MLAKAIKGGVLICVKNGIGFVPPNNLDIQIDKKLESRFIEIQNTNCHNAIVDVIYKNSTMDLSDFINDQLCQLTQRFSKESKPIYIAVDWNFNIL